MQINERENERKPKVNRAKTNLEVLSTCWMEVFGLLNLKRRSKSPTCGTKITLRHHYYKLPRLNLDTQAFWSQYQRSLPPSCSSPTEPLSSTSAILIESFQSSRILGLSWTQVPLICRCRHFFFFFFFFILFRLIVLFRTLKKYSKRRFQFASLHSPHPDLCPLGITIYSGTSI